LEFNNFKNSLKSGGSWIVAIDDLPHQLECLHAFLSRFRTPVSLFASAFVKGCNLKSRAIYPGCFDNVHFFILSLY